MTQEELVATIKAQIDPAMAGMKDMLTGQIKDIINPLLSPIESKLKLLTPAEQKRIVAASGRVAMYKKAGVLDFSEDGLKQSRQFLSDIVQHKALSEDTAADGGYTVPIEFNANIMRIQSIAGAVRRNTMVWPMSTDTMDIPCIAGSVTIYYPGESTAATETSGTSLFGNVQLAIKDAVGLIAMSDRLLYDTKVNLTEILAVLFGEAMAVSEDAQALRGTGSPFTGINAVVTGDNIIELGGATIQTITYADIINAEMAIPSGAIAKAKWYMSNWVFRNLRNIKDDNKMPIFAGPKDAMPATLDGFPVELTDGALTANAASSCMIVFGDMNYLGFGDSTQGNRMQLTNQATLTTAGNLFEKNMSALKIVQSKSIVASSDLKEAFSVIRTSA